MTTITLPSNEPKIPKNLVEQLVEVINSNARFSIGRDATCLWRVRDLLVAAGCVKQVDLYDCAVIEDGCGHSVSTGCVDCGRHGVHNDEGLCNDCRGPVDDGNYEECLGCGDLADCDEEQLCHCCGG